MKKVLLILAAAALLLTACESDKPDLSPLELYERISDEVELPIMVDIDEDRLGDYHVSPDDAVSFVAKEAAISAIFVQLIIIEAKEGKASEVQSAMREHQSQLKDDAFYPQGREAAAASIVGTRGSVVYLICIENAQEIENIIKG